jgi:hypothetical protein
MPKFGMYLFMFEFMLVVRLHEEKETDTCVHQFM